MRGGILITLAAFLSGCASVPAPQKVMVEVARPCLEAPQLPAQPVAKTDSELAQMSDFDLVISLASDRLEYRRYANEATAILIACTK